jgi:hypothetical protein
MNKPETQSKYQLTAVVKSHNQLSYPSKSHDVYILIQTEDDGT